MTPRRLALAAVLLMLLVGFFVAVQLILGQEGFWHRLLIEPAHGRAVVEQAKREEGARVTRYTVRLSGLDAAPDYGVTGEAAGADARVQPARVYSAVRDDVGETVEIQWMSPPLGEPYLVSVNGRGVAPSAPAAQSVAWIVLSAAPFVMALLLLAGFALSRRSSR